MNKTSKKQYFLMAVLSVLCSTPMAFSDEISLKGVEPVAEIVALEVEEDFDAVKKAAKSTGKKILLEFSGNDWCPPCKMLKKFVLDTEEFAKFAKEKLHVVVADFDRYGEPTNKRFANRYKALAEEFGLRGFPTLVILSPEGDVQDIIVGLEVRSPAALIERIGK